MGDNDAAIITPKRHYSVARVTNAWYVAARQSELRNKPIARTIFDTPLVLFRDKNGTPHALIDRCAHRNVPLSMGEVEGGRLVCGYHGWAYDGEGVCQKVPALCGEQTGKARRVLAFKTIERHGYVWVYLTPGVEPDSQPFELPLEGDARYATMRYDAEVPATLHAASENILDVPHTAFLHRGLFRGVKQNEITAVVRREADRVEAEFIGEPRPAGMIGSLLAPQGGTVVHFDRFILPSIAQVEYKLGDKNHILISNVLTPVSDFVTKMYTTVTYRTVFPAMMVRAILGPLAMKVLHQDVVMLKAQTAAVKRFEGEQFASTDVDLLGPHIWRLLKQAERGDKPPTEPTEQRIQIIA